MQTSSFQYINVLPYSDLMNWSVNYHLDREHGYNDSFELVKIGSVIKRNRDKVKLENEELYTQVTIKLWGKGVVERTKKYGKDIGTKNQYKVSAGQFIMSKIDARNGAFGIVPDELQGAITTQDFLSYNINKEKIHPKFLKILTSTDQFLKFCQSASTGTTGRRRIDEKFFLSIQIPLPSIVEQEKIVKAYNEKVIKARSNETTANQKKFEIENLFNEYLGLPPMPSRISKKGLHFVKYSLLDRWDLLAKDLTILNGLEHSKYKIKKIGEAFQLPKRSWNKKNFGSETFNYVELGNIDDVKGILFNKVLPVKKAPSRATQQIFKGDLLIGTTRPYLKRFAIVSDEFDGNIASSGFTVIEPDQSYNLIYLREFLFSPYGIEQLKNKMTGATYPAITIANLMELLVPFPPIEVQNEIAEKVLTKNNEIVENLMLSEELKKEAIIDFEQQIFKSA